MDPIVTLGGLVLVAGQGILGNRADAGLTKVWETVQERVARLGPPENHDILRAIHKAYLETVLVVVNECKQEAMADSSLVDRFIKRKFSDVSLLWLDARTSELRAALQNLPNHLPPPRSVLDNVDPALLVADDQASATNSVATFKDQLIKQILAEFSGENRPQRFTEMVEDGWRVANITVTGKVDVCMLLCAFFVHELKTNHRVHTIFADRILSGLSLQGAPLTLDALEQQLSQLSQGLEKRLSQIEDLLMKLLDQQDGITALTISLDQIRPLILLLPTIAEQQQQILEQIQQILVRLEEKQTPRPVVLPPVEDFVGREDERAHLVSVLKRATQGSTTIGCISGMGGLGKTQLARAVIQELAPDFPDGQAEINLYGVEHPISPIKALQDIIHQFTPDANVPDDLDQLQGQYRALLGNKRVIILADNAADVAQIRPLTPPAGSLLLITSRLRFSPAGVPSDQIVELQALSAPTAVQFVLNLCPRLDQKSAALLGKYCSYLPLALRLSATLLREDKTLNIQEYLSLLEEELTRLDSLADPENPPDAVSYMIGLSYAALAQDYQATLRQLSLCRTSFDRNAVIAIRQLSALEARAHISHLYRRSLLERVSDDRYLLHDLIRLFASQEMQQPEREAAQQRYIAYYTSLAERYAVELDSVEERTALRQFELDREHLHTALSWAITAKDAGTATKLASSLCRFWDRQGYVQEGRAFLKNVLALPQGTREADPTFILDRAEAIRGAGSLALTQHDFESAEELLQHSLSLFQDQGNKLGIARAQNSVAEAALKQRQFPVAEQYLNQSLRLFQELGNTLSETVVLGNLGYVAQQNGDYDEAVKRLTRSREILEQLPNTLHRQADVLHNLANIHWSQQEYGQARATHEEALALRERLGSRPGIANSHDGLGWAFLGLGDLDAAERYFGQSLPVFQEISDGEGVIFGMEGLAKVALGREQFERAVKLLIYIASMLGEQPAEMYENELNQAAERLSRDEYAAAEAVGRGLTREAALALALGPSV